MSAYLRRFTEQPTQEVILEIEGVNIIDIAPPAPATGVGTGAVLVVGEFEDGFFSTDAESKGSVEVFGSSDLESKFGGFGYVHDGVVSSSPSARRHLSEFWNGNGFIKLFKMKATRIMIGRVDTSVGSVSFEALSCVDAGGAGGQTFALANGDILSVTTDAGAGVSDPLAAAVATVAGAAQAFATIVSGETVEIAIDGGITVPVTFSGTDVTVATVVDRINSTIGRVVAVDNAGELDLSGFVAGTAGAVTLSEVSPGILTKLGHSAGTTNGTGDVANVDAVTATELAAFINADAQLPGQQVEAEVLPTGTLRICNNVSNSTSTINVLSSSMGSKLFLGDLVDTVVNASNHEGGTISAGTRVDDGTTTYVTMQTLDVPEGDIGPYVVKVRPALDDGNGLGAAAGTVTNVSDSPSFASVRVNNPAALSAAKNEVQMDNAYIEAFNATLNDQGVAKEANYLVSARRSDTIVREGRANVVKATSCGLDASRKFLTGDPLGTSISDILANVALFRSDRVFYTGKGLKVRIPGIAERGVAGGIGFTVDGVITVRPDGPLATVCAIRPPEENPGQQTNLIDDFFEVDTFGDTVEIEAYKAFKREGVIVPRITSKTGTTFQSGVTSSLESGRKTAARRKMADFLGDSMAQQAMPFAKKLSKQTRRDALYGTIEEFLGTLKSETNPELQRIEDYSLDDTINAGNTNSSLALGIYRINVTVRTLASMDHIVLTVEAGENAVTVTAG